MATITASRPNLNDDPSTEPKRNETDLSNFQIRSATPAPEQNNRNDSSGEAKEAGQIFISWLVLGVFVTSFVLATVGLGLLVSLVNNPTCDTTSSSSSVRSNRITREKLKTMSQLNILKELSQDPNVQEYRTEYEFCPEILEPADGKPWDSKRLPTNIVPIRYEITLRTPIFSATTYNGEITIQFQVKQPTQYILLHSRFLADYLPTLTDAAGNEVYIACTGDYLPNDYHIIKTVQPLSVGVYSIDLFYTGSLIAFSNGIFDVKYNLVDNEFEGNMLASHFEPVDARLAFPCFDEPQLKAEFSIRLYHPPSTIALSNMPALSEEPVEDEILTIFQKTPRLPIYLIAMLVFKSSDFTNYEVLTSSGLPIRVWARKEYVDSGSAEGPAKLMAEIFNNFDFISNDVPEAIPQKLDVFAIPYYPQDSVGHSGLFIFEENKILFKEGNVQERIKQSIALEMAKQIATLWFGNYVTFKWWNELWLQESISDYVKYRAIDRTYPSWRVSDQFITEELINVLVEDSYPSSHPVIKDVDSPEEIDQLFDIVETSKGAAILKMMDYQIGPSAVYAGLINYLKKGASSGIGDANFLWDALDDIRIWTAREFADRWLRQANYPLIRARIIQKQDGLYYFSATQEKFSSNYSIFSGQELYPSPFNNEWYIPLTCSFGVTPTDPEIFDDQFNIETATFEGLIGDGTIAYNWVHCDTLFEGYYLLEYTADNWDNLGEALKADNPNLSPRDRANIIHNLFMNTFNGKTSYNQLARDLTYLKQETDYLPWKTAIKHIYDLAGILEYRRSFLQLSSYFLDELTGIEYSTDLWTASGDHIEELKREVILEFACRMQDPICLMNSTALWEATFPTPSVVNANFLAPHVRSVVYNYHLQNTYDTSEWRLIIDQYAQIPDIQDRELLVEAVSYSRIPWVLLKFLDEITEGKKSFSKLNFFYTLALLAKNPLGREIAWNYYRANYAEIVGEFGYENPEIGSSLINIVKTFSDEFNYFELLKFISETSGEANSDARLRSIEIVSTNVIWLDRKEDEIIEAFGGIRRNTELAAKSKIDNLKLKAKLRKAFDEKFEWPLKKKSQAQK